MNIPIANLFSRKKKKKKKERRGGHMIKYLLIELVGPDGKIFGPRSVRHDLGRNIFPSGPPTQSISTCYATN